MVSGVDDPFRVTVLGCAGSYPGPASPCSGYLLRGYGTTVALDLGPGTLATLQEHVAIGDLDGVVISHVHADHWTDLIVLRTAWKYGLGRVGLPVVGPGEAHERALVATDEQLAPSVDWRRVADGDEAVIGALRFRFARTDHYVDTLAVHVQGVDGGPSLAYSADTGPGWSFEAFDAPIDLALCEASHTAEHEPAGILHLSGRQAGAMCRQAGVRRLVVTHLVPGVDHAEVHREATEAFGGPTDLAAPHMTYEV